MRINYFDFYQGLDQYRKTLDSKIQYMTLSQKNSYLSLSDSWDDWIDSFEKSRLICLQNDVNIHEGGEDKKIPIFDDKFASIDLDLPFEICWFERLGAGELSQLYDGNEINKKHAISHLMIREVSPRRYVFYVNFSTANYDQDFLERRDKNNFSDTINYLSAHFVIQKEGDVFYPVLVKLTKEILGHMKRCQIGTVKIGNTIKIKNRGIKSFKKINRVVLCGKKREMEDAAKAIFTKEVDWSHKWEVRGHWRKCKYLGKNRSGDYCIDGFTWVKAHQKGSGELVVKARVFSEEANSNTGMRVSDETSTH